MVRVGIFGATGAVGKEILSVLEEKELPIDDLVLFASERSEGKEMETFLGKKILQNANEADYSQLDIAFFAIGGGWPKENAPKAVENSCFVIDNSSMFRYDDAVPLVIPQINASAIGDSKLIANPNCTTAIAALPLFALHEKYGLKKIIMSTYQATSGAGAEGMRELKEQTRAVLDGGQAGSNVFQHPIPFNVIPHIDAFQDNLYTKEEMKVVWETQKIFSDDSLRISCTAVRIPTLRAHAESIVIETGKPIDPDEARALLRNVEGVIVKDNPSENEYPMPLTATGTYPVEVGRIRQSLVFGDHGLELFVCGDQLLRGAALNAVEIAEKIVEKIQ